MPNNTPISLKDLARMARVSTATVSRVLNNNGRFSEETRKRVLDLIRQTGYAPNVAAKALRTRTARAIGLVIPDVANQFFSHIVDAMGKVCFAKDYSLFVCNADEDAERNRAMIRNLLGKGVDGLIYISRFPLGLQSEAVPVVCLDRVSPEDAGRVTVISDNYNGGLLAAKALVTAGTKHPVVLCDPDDIGLSTIDGRLDGFEAGMRACSMRWSRRSGIVKVPMRINAVRERVARLARSGRSFDGIFATLDIGAIGAILGLEDVGLRVPDDVNVIGFDDIPYGEFWRPPLTTIRQDVVALAMTGSAMLFDLMEKRSLEQEHVSIPVELVERGSTRR